MPYDDEIIVNVRHLSGGRNLACESAEMAEGELMEMINYNFRDGGIAKRPGQAAYNTSSITERIREMLHYKGQFQPARVLFTTSDSLYRLSGNGTVTLVKSMLSGDTDFAVRNSILFGVNPLDGLFSYHGGSVGGVMKHSNAPKAGTIAENNGVLFLGDVEGAKDRVMYSDPNDLTFGLFNWVGVSSGRSDRVIKVFAMNLLVYAATERGLFLLRNIGLNSYARYPVRGMRGCASRRSLALCGDFGAAYLANENGALKVALFDGVGVGIISHKIGPDMLKIDRGKVEEACGIFVDGQYWLSVTESSGTRCTHVYDFVRKAWTRFEGLYFGAATTTPEGQVMIARQDGDILQYPHMSKDDSTEITTTMRTQFHQAGARAAKSFRRFGLECTRAGNANLTVNTYKDYDVTTTDTGTISLGPADPHFYYGDGVTLLDGATEYYGPRRRAWLECGIALPGARAVSVELIENAVQELRVFGYQMFGKQTRKS